MRRASFYAAGSRVSGSIFTEADRGPLPRRFLAQEEVGVVDPQANLITLLSDVAVSKWLQC